MNNDKLYVCKNCIEKLRNEPSETYIQYRGFYTILKVPENKICPMCKETLSMVNISEDDAITLAKIHNDTNFIEAMIKLHDTDIAEYELKMSQFRIQIQQKNQVEHQDNMRPHCPHCHSTNIKSISGFNRGASIAMWGLFSKKLNKSFECLDCKYTW